MVVSAEDEVYSELVHSSHHILRSAYYSGILRLGAARVEGPVDNHDVPQCLGAVLDSVLNEGEVLAHRAHVHIQVHEQSVVVGVVVVRRCGADTVGRAEIREVVVVCIEGCVVMSRTVGGSYCNLADSVYNEVVVVTLCGRVGYLISARYDEGCLAEALAYFIKRVYPRRFIGG